MVVKSEVMYIPEDLQRAANNTAKLIFFIGSYFSSKNIFIIKMCYAFYNFIHIFSFFYWCIYFCSVVLRSLIQGSYLTETQSCVMSFTVLCAISFQPSSESPRFCGCWRNGAVWEGAASSTVWNAGLAFYTVREQRKAWWSRAECSAMTLNINLNNQYRAC